MKKLVNLTNHEINIITPEGLKTIEPSGQIARVNYEIVEIDEVMGIPVVEIMYKKVMGLPEPKKGVYYIVSSVVKNAIGLSRKDVITLYGIKRRNGTPFACSGFRVNG